MSENIAERAWKIVEPILRHEGLELVDVHYGREGGRWILRLLIDRPGAGVGLEDCQQASRAVDTALEVADLIPHEYSLEVSSPGIDRPLTRPEHFERFLGHKVRVRTFAPLFDPPRKNFVGTLAAHNDEVLVVEVEGAGRFEIPRKEIAKANLEPVWD